MQRKIKRYGWVRDLPHSAKKFRSVHAPIAIPPMVDLRSKCPSVYDQGELGSCTANGIAGAIQFIKPALMPSRLFIYYNERSIEGDVDQDAGAQIHDGIKSVQKQGVCAETEWPYAVADFRLKPTEKCYEDALVNVLTDFLSIDTLGEIKQALANGNPVVFGMAVFPAFESPEVASSGVVPMPADDEEPIGGHCMLIVGYDDSKNAFIVRNSWGAAWGESGYCHIPYSYIQNYASDFWSIH